MAPEEKLVRLPIYRYIKSGKLFAVQNKGGYTHIALIDLSADMSRITKVRAVKFVKKESVAATKYVLEAKEWKIQSDDKSWNLNYRRLRILTQEDVDIERWKSTEDLSNLPVLAEDYITEEEYIWSGKRNGNISGSIALTLVALGLSALTYKSFSDGNLSWFLLIVTAILSLCLIVFGWRRSVPPDAERLNKLKARKKFLQQERAQNREADRTVVTQQLEDFSFWRQLTPYQFEQALTLRLRDEGFDVVTTQASADGGIDIKGKDNNGQPVIVQAKQYQGNVGVGVVQQMIGVRETHDSKPRTIIYSLEGFTRGAKKLAAKSDVELRNIKSELMGI